MGGAKAAAVRVLVVDDSSVDRKVVELLLRNHKGGAAPFHGEFLNLLAPCLLSLSQVSSDRTIYTRLSLTLFLLDYHMFES
jgi:CheY-like chemotaxis protein